jgi:hypothetical protein
MHSWQPVSVLPTSAAACTQSTPTEPCRLQAPGRRKKENCSSSSSTWQEAALRQYLHWNAWPGVVWLGHCEGVHQPSSAGWCMSHTLPQLHLADQGHDQRGSRT